mgnify:CR=1 FL=1
MEYKNFFRWLELAYRIDINSELRNTLAEHFGENLNIYTDQDLYEQSRKILQDYRERYITRYKKYRFEK